MKTDKTNTTQKRREHVYNLDSGYLTIKENNKVVSNKPFHAENNKLRIRECGTLVAGNSYSTILNDLAHAAKTAHSFQAKAATLNESLIQPLKETQERFRSQIINPAIKAAEVLGQSTGEYKKFAKTLKSMSQPVIGDMNSLSIGIGKPLTDMQNSIVKDLQNSLNQNYIIDNTIAPKVIRSTVELPLEPFRERVDDYNTSTLEIESFKQVKDDYLVGASVSSVTTYQPLSYERINTIEMRIRAIDKGQKVTHEKLTGLLNRLDRQEESLQELTEYIRKQGGNKFSLQDIHYNSKHSRLIIQDERVDLSRANNQSLLCQIIFSDKTGIGKIWDMDELVESYTENDYYSLTSRERSEYADKIRYTAYNLNDKIAKLTSTKQFLIISTSQIYINPNLLD